MDALICGEAPGSERPVGDAPIIMLKQEGVARKRLGLGPGQVLDLRERKGCLIAEKLADRDAVWSVYGILRLGRGADSLMRELRGGTGPQ